MKQIVLDTETTGLDWNEHRIIEIGCLEMEERTATGRTFHHYLNPEREVDQEAYRVHGMSWADLLDKPLFADIAHEFIDFISGAELLIHNAEFDLSFLNSELARFGMPPVEEACSKITDTLTLARRKHSGLKNSLDNLCHRYKVDNTKRNLHGALLDANLLMEVYLRMTSGQSTMALPQEQANPGERPWEAESPNPRLSGKSLKVVMASPEELKNHAMLMESLRKESAEKGQ